MWGVEAEIQKLTVHVQMLTLLAINHEEVIPHPEPNLLSIKPWLHAVPRLHTDWGGSHLDCIVSNSTDYSQDQEAL